MIDIGRLASDLAAAIAVLESAENTESMARNETTSARNRVNDLQKKIDAAVEEMREASPRSTDWADRKSCKIQVGEE